MKNKNFEFKVEYSRKFFDDFWSFHPKKSEKVEYSRKFFDDFWFNFALNSLFADELAKDYKQSYDNFKMLSYKGYPEAQYYLGYIYKNGLGVKRDIKEAKKYFNRAFHTYFSLAKQNGDSISKYYLGLMYLNGNIFERKDSIRAFNNFLESAKQGYDKSQLILGYLYKDGDGIEQDYAQAINWFSKSAEQGNVDAKYNLGIMYKDGLGVKRDIKEANKFFKETFDIYSKRANNGNNKALFKLALMYLNGYGVEQNYQEAIKLFKKSADIGNVDAKFLLGDIYRKGLGIPRDNEQADKYYKEVFEVYSKRAENGDQLAQYKLAYMYIYGRGVDNNYKEGVEYLKKSAEQGYLKAQYKLANIYKDGIFTGKNKEESDKYFKECFEFYKKLADIGDVFAQYRIGYMYKEGLGVEQNYQEAIKYLKISADNGNEEAEYYILEIYEKNVFDVFNSIFFMDNINISEIEKKLRTSNFEHYFEQFLISIEKSIDIKKYIDNLFEYFKYFKYLSSKLKTKLFELCSKSIDKIKNDDEFIMIMQGMLGTLILYGFGVKQNKSKAFELFLKSSEHGNTFAIYNLGCMYERGFGIEQDYKKAFDCFKKIELKDISGIAQYKLGEIYEQGLLGVQKDINKAIEYYKRAAEQNSSFLWVLGDIYFLGLGVKQDYNSAINYYISSTIDNYSESSSIYSHIEFCTLYELFVKDMSLNIKKRVAGYKDQVIMLAIEGNVNALIHLGLMYQYGIGVDVNIKKAKEYYLKAFEKKDELQDNIIYYFAEKYYYGKSRIFEKNIDKAIELYSIAAEKGNKEAQYELAEIYELGMNNVKQDYDKAIYWYSKLAEQEDKYFNSLQYKIAEIYEKKKQDYDKAIYLYSKLAEQDYKGRVKVEYNIGKIYQQELKDYDKAIYWYSKVIEEKNDDNYYYDYNYYNNLVHKLIIELGEIYEKGLGVEKNINKAIEYYQISAKQGNLSAQLKLADIYYNGKEIKQDYKKAFEWYKKSAENGDIKAQNILTIMYFEGKGIKQDFKKAVKLLSKSAEQNYAPAQYLLGFMYEYGYFIEQDINKAVEYYKRSAEQGYKEAKESLERLEIKE